MPNHSRSRLQKVPDVHDLPSEGNRRGLQGGQGEDDSDKEARPLIGAQAMVLRHRVSGPAS